MAALDLSRVFGRVAGAAIGEWSRHRLDWGMLACGTVTGPPPAPCAFRTPGEYFPTPYIRLGTPKISCNLTLFIQYHAQI